MDHGRLGHVGDQPPRALLSADGRWPSPARAGARGLGATLGRDLTRYANRLVAGEVPLRILHQIVPLFRALFRGGRVDADLADEMRFHVEREMEANIARGMSRDAARRAARLKFGSVDNAQ